MLVLSSVFQFVGATFLLVGMGLITYDVVKVIIETLEKFGMLSIKSGTTPIFTLYKRHKDSFMYYVFSNPDKISLSKSNLNADNEETKLLYKEFLRFVNESYTAYRNNK